MFVGLDWFSGSMEAKPYLFSTDAALRECRAGDGRDLMRQSMIVPVHLVVDHIVDAGRLCFISRFEFVFHGLFLLWRECLDVCFLVARLIGQSPPVHPE
ncbi:MAG: hypothetical protein JO270_15970 [Acidobacteriaceae bacterium]|nr:hypothetical protein [Acidobacteriaceae bacterium]